MADLLCDVKHKESQMGFVIVVLLALAAAAAARYGVYVLKNGAQPTLRQFFGLTS